MQVGGALGLAVLATLSSTRVKDVVASGGSSDAAIASGLHLALVVGAGLVIAAIVVGVTVLTPARALAQAPVEDEEPVRADGLHEADLYPEAA
jgi:hypothetical protein